ncbi:hypothetical protein P8452_16590 [Trifolium repens]|nr:hypothetical protein P8452_16590 [Trifolium repens]
MTYIGKAHLLLPSLAGSRNQWKANKKEMKIGHGACCLAVKENERKEGLYILLSKPFYLLFKFCISIFKYYKIIKSGM